ncbi:hypothetical protein D9M71_445130 [compost metagenome]
MRSILGQADARQVDVHAAIRLVRPEQLDLQARVFLVQATVVVGVDQADVALAGLDRLQQRGVVGEHVSGQVVHPALENLLSLLGAVGFDQGGGERLVVDLLRRAQAQATFPVLVGQRFVGGQLFRLNPLGGIGDGPRTQRQAGPAVGAGAVLRRDVGVEDRRVERLQDAHLLGLPEVAGIHREQQIGRRIGALGLDPRHQRGFLVGDELHLDAGLGGVGIEHRLDQLVDARGVDHHLVGRLRCTGQCGEHESGEQSLTNLHVASPGQMKDSK